MPNQSPDVALVNMDTQGMDIMRERLLGDIKRLERLLEQLRCGDDSQDYSLQQTYREMIYSRRKMLNGLPIRHSA